jgi:hypothetical protein
MPQNIGDTRTHAVVRSSISGGWLVVLAAVDGEFAEELAIVRALDLQDGVHSPGFLPVQAAMVKPATSW